MARLSWADRDYDIGVNQGVVYPRVGPAEAWNGLVSVNETPSDIYERVRYREGRKIVNQRAEDSFSASVEAFTYPESLLKNPRARFEMSYRVNTDKSYKIHLVYNVTAHMLSKRYAQDDATPFRFNISTAPVAIPEAIPSAHLIIDGSIAYPQALSAFEAALYGDDDLTPRLPSPDEVFDIFDINALYKVIDNGDGTFTLEAPDEAIEWLSATLFDVDWPQPPVFLDENTYVIRSW